MLFNLVSNKGMVPTISTDKDKADMKKLMLQDTGALSKEEQKRERLEALRNKIKAVGRMSRIFKNLR